jgi:hypothetical protein
MSSQNLANLTNSVGRAFETGQKVIIVQTDLVKMGYDFLANRTFTFADNLADKIFLEVIEVGAELFAITQTQILKLTFSNTSNEYILESSVNLTVAFPNQKKLVISYNSAGNIVTVFQPDTTLVMSAEMGVIITPDPVVEENTTIPEPNGNDTSTNTNTTIVIPE